MAKNAAIITLSALLAGSGVGNFIQWKNNKADASLLETKLSETKQLMHDKDSINMLLNQFEKRLNESETQRNELVGIVEELEQSKANLQVQISQARNQVPRIVNKAGMDSLKNIVASLKTQTANYLKENESLKTSLAEANSKNSEYANNMSMMEQANTEMQNKINSASIPVFGNLLAKGLYVKKGQSKEIYKAKLVQNLNFSLDLLENKLVNTESEEEITIRVIDPEKHVLTDGKLDATLTDTDKLYTLKQKLVYSGKQQKINYKFTPPSKYKFKKGDYYVELINRGEIKQRSTFKLE